MQEASWTSAAPHRHRHRLVSLRRLWPDARIVNSPEILIDSLTDRADQVNPGDLFVARTGPANDGHSFAGEAIERGAEALLVQRELPDFDVPQCVIGNTNRGFGELCQAVHGDPSRQLPVVGVTGTDGKTTTCWLVRSILSHQVSRGLPSPVASCGTIDVDDGLIPQPAHLTTLGAAGLASWLGRARANGATSAVLELSSHALDQERAAGIELQCAVVTNFGHDHLDYHETREHYARSKASICNLLVPGGTLVLNEQAAASILPHASSWRGRTVVVGRGPEADFRIVSSASGCHGQRLQLDVSGTELAVESPLIGAHNAENIATAIAVANSLGVDTAAIGAGVASLDSVPGRLERVENNHSMHVLVDYAHTPDAIASAISAVRGLAPRVIVVCGAGGDRDQNKRPMMGRALANADCVFLTSDNPRSESARAICTEIESGLDGTCNVTTVVDRASAIRQAIRTANHDDYVLVLGKGHETTQTILGESLAFDDRVVCAEALADWDGPGSS